MCISMTHCVPILVITGPVGVGKTSVASEVSERLDDGGIAHALVDVDSLRWCYPRPAADPFRIRLAMQNLAAIWLNLQAAGARRLVLTDVIESGSDLDRISNAITGAEIRVVRLRATVATLTARVNQRETGLGRTRHLERALQLAQQLDSAAVGDIVVDTDARTVVDVANEIVNWTGWLARSAE